MDIIESGFNDVFTGDELFRALDINEGDMKSPIIQNKIVDIAKFLNESPDPMFVITRIRNNKSSTMNNLDYLHSYVQLNRQKTQIEEQLSKVTKDLKMYE